MMTDHLGSSGVLEVSEPGTVQMQVFAIGGLQSLAACKTVPQRLDQVEGWLAQKQWFQTCWYKGYLSQQGGDVKNWRRRYFKVIGAKMEAYHEFTKEYRTTIDLSQAVGMKPLHLRLDTELYPMKYSFRMHFKHGEHIDFYADSEEKYEQWMGVLRKVLESRPEECPSWIGEAADTNSGEETTTMIGSRVASVEDLPQSSLSSPSLSFCKLLTTT
jgi:hypothetical protein